MPMTDATAPSPCRARRPNDPFALPASSAYDALRPAAPAPLPRRTRSPCRLPPRLRGQDPFALPPPPASEDPFALPPPPGQPRRTMPSPCRRRPDQDFSPAGWAPPRSGAALAASSPSPRPRTPPSRIRSPWTSRSPAARSRADFSLDFAEPRPRRSPRRQAPANVGTDFGDISFNDRSSRRRALPRAELARVRPHGPAEALGWGRSRGGPLRAPAAPAHRGQRGRPGDAQLHRRRRRRAAAPRARRARSSASTCAAARARCSARSRRASSSRCSRTGSSWATRTSPPDSENWTPIGTVPSFAAAIQRLMEGPASQDRPPAVAPATHRGWSPGRRADPQASMDRLKQLYEGRMARSRSWTAAAPTTSGASACRSSSAGRGGARAEHRRQLQLHALRRLRPSQALPRPRVRRLAAATDVENARKALLQDTFAATSRRAI